MANPPYGQKSIPQGLLAIDSNKVFQDMKIACLQVKNSYIMNYRTYIMNYPVIRK
jgi:hypothetical protein